MAKQVYGTEDDDVLFAYNDDETYTIHGLGGHDKIDGGRLGDHLLGDSGNDIIYGDYDWGLGLPIVGEDYLDGGTGDDILHGGTPRGAKDNSDDTLAGGDGDDQLYGDGGNDTLYAGTGGDTLDGGAGNDRVYADGSDAHRYDYIKGSEGDDTYFVDGSNIAFHANGDDGGDDRLVISAGVSLIYDNGVHVEIEDITLTGTGAFFAFGNSLDNIIRGNSAANHLRGHGGADELFGNGGDDTLDGGNGYLDTLLGGRGNDTYIVSDFDDIWEGFEQGSDTVQSSVRWVLADNFENLTLTGGANVNGFGNGLGNQMTGNAGNNYLQGYANFDTLAGGNGNDHYELGDLTNRDGFVGYIYDSVTEGAAAGIDTVSVTSIDDPDAFADGYVLPANIENGIIVGALAFSIVGNALGNQLTGNAVANTLLGAAGDDTLNGLGGFDKLTGGSGNDTFVLADSTSVNGALEWDAVSEAIGGGLDTVRASSTAGRLTYGLGANIENAVATGGSRLNLVGNELANELVGNAAANVLTGNQGSDTLFGGRGYDKLIGGAGDDTFVLTDASSINGALEWDDVDENAFSGIDTVQASSAVGRLTYILGANVENVVTLDEGRFNLVGNELDNRLAGNNSANTLTGLDGDDTLAGFGGVDVLKGGRGDDVASYATYANLVGVVADLLSPGGNTGDAAGDSYESIEGLLGSFYGDTLRGDNLDNVLGGGLNGADSLFGRDGDDTLDGGVGGDSLDGGLGDDILRGGNGDDVVRGGAGADLLSGGLSADSFFFGLGAAGITATTADNVSDWSSAFDEIDMTFAGSSANYLEASTGATTIGGAAAAAEDMAGASTAYAFLFNSATGTGYLLADLDNDNQFETGIVLAGAGAAASFGFLDIV